MTRLPDAKTSGVDENPWERVVFEELITIKGTASLADISKGPAN